MVEEYRAKFGLDQPLMVQYVRYMGNMFRFDFGYSLALYPTTVMDVIKISLPWTIGLLSVSLVISFTLGTLVGGLLGWPRTPKAFSYMLSPFLLMSSVPYYLIGLLFIYILAFRLKIFPIGGGSQVGQMPSFTLSYILDILYHSILPALSIVVAGIGGWALGMRGMIINTLGEDYIILAQARGLPSRRIFFWYAMRNALLPADDLAGPLRGVGRLRATPRGGDLSLPGHRATASSRPSPALTTIMIYGIVFFIILTIATATLIIDLLYPLLDPRIRYQKS